MQSRHYTHGVLYRSWYHDCMVFNFSNMQGHKNKSESEDTGELGMCVVDLK